MVGAPEGKRPEEVIPWHQSSDSFDKEWTRKAHEDEHQTHLNEVHKWGR